ncbi:E3 ubiquitin-protein ligase RHA1B [Acorus calamus]|uniref:E3 ubiquitin-protein ligase RHA1B n=1 Tax=Acorus calamus TaxID=4465 RepID=A0AAV9CJF3_ACOCL|nr:E3 ubiquitin-protein ligase RHA1B [Acorus calamus]
MSFSVDYSSWVVRYVLQQVALLLALIRWLHCWAVSIVDPPETHPQQPGPSPVSAQMVRDSLHVSTYGEVLPEGEGVGNCAVCLNELKRKDKVRELRNCCHVFHKRCLDRWVDHDELRTCPLCRAPLLAGLALGSAQCSRSEPSWAVENLLYLFGDDLPTYYQ